MTAPNITTIDATTTVTTTVVVPPSAPKPHGETPEEKGQRILTHQLMARQLEYYFSTANLSRDTYLSTLRDLNDSYVPISIIANFGKVQALAPYDSALEAVVTAATEHSDLLEIVELDEEGKRISSNQEEKKDETEQATAIIQAIGSITGKPIPMSQIPKTDKHKRTKSVAAISTAPAPASNPEQSAPSGSSGRNIQNTVILREVAKDVDEETLRNLFKFEGCPSIESIREDLHNCWFVTLDTSSKDIMFNVMMQLRTTKFPSGDSVKARLKSSSSSSPLTATAVVFNPKISTMYAPQFNSKNGGSNNSRKKRSNNKGRSNNSSSGANATTKSKNNQQSGGNTSKRRNSKDMTNKQTTPNDGAKTRPKKAAQKAPAMGESNFPSLPPTSDGDSKPFQVEKVDDEMLRSCEKERRSSGFSDSSSTATTSTESTPYGSMAGGYAAALLRPAAPTPVAVKKAVVEKAPTKKAKDTTKKAMKPKEVKIEDKKTTESNFQPTVTVQPPTWGQGRSFADIVSA